MIVRRGEEGKVSEHADAQEALLREYVEAFARRGGAQSPVEADEAEVGGVTARPDHGGSELQGVCGAQLMDAEEAAGGGPNFFGRLHLAGAGNQIRHLPQQVGRRFFIYHPNAPSPADR